jgi:hypothetical protein
MGGSNTARSHPCCAPVPSRYTPGVHGHREPRRGGSRRFQTLAPGLPSPTPETACSLIVLAALRCADHYEIDTPLKELVAKLNQPNHLVKTFQN